MSRSDLEALLQEALAPQRRSMAGAMLSAAAAAVAAVLLLGLSGWFITGAALAGAAGLVAAQAFNYLLPSATIRLLAILRTVARYGERFYSHRAALTALATLRARLFVRLLGARDIRSWSAGDTVARLVQDIGALEDRLVRKPALPAALAGSAAGLALCAAAGIGAMLALLLLLLVLPLAARFAAPRLLAEPATQMAEALGWLKDDFVAYTAASPEIAAYGIAPAIGAGLEARARALDAARLRFARAEAMIGATLAAGGGFAMAAVLALSKASLPLTVMAVLAAAGAVESLSALVRGLVREATVSASLARLEVLAGQAPGPMRAIAASNIHTIELPSGAGTASLGSGDRLGIVGSSGSGKTRLLETLAGVRPDEGSGLRIDGQPLDRLDISALRASFALSPQDALLISGTIADNLRLARPGLTDEALWAALEVACLADEIRATSNGLNHWAGDGGARLSGGQRKRLSIARTLLADRPWLLLDEPSEGLDPATEARLVKRLGAWLRDRRTGLILATHRPAMLALADRVLDLDRQSILANVAAEPRACD